jgi:outer membrane receptor protein involved in Fe transport
MDASAQYALGLGALNIGISNLFNDSYENVTSAAGGFHPTVAEGRRLTLGYQIHF